MMATLTYHKPGLYSGRREMGQWFKYKEVDLTECDKGKYVVAATGESEALIMGLLWRGTEILAASFLIKEHNELGHENVLKVLAEMGKSCPKETVILGGGMLIAEHDAKVIRVVSQSGSFGYVPSFMIEEGFSVPDYKIEIEIRREAAGPEFRKSADVLEWFGKNGIAVEY